MGDGEGSKAMTIYIVACFALAMMALIGYKYVNDQRSDLETEYIDLANRVADISGAYALNINDYYRKVQAGEIKVVDKEVRDGTRTALREIADKLGIKSGSGEDNHLDMGFQRERLVNRQYTEYSLEVSLNNVTQTEWAVFLSQAQHATREYAHVQNVRIDRAERRFARMEIVKDRNADSTLWNVKIKFIWFGPKDDAARS